MHQEPVTVSRLIDFLGEDCKSQVIYDGIRDYLIIKRQANQVAACKLSSWRPNIVESSNFTNAIKSLILFFKVDNAVFPVSHLLMR